MKIYKLKDMIKGWFIGNFEPSVFKTEAFEVGILQRKSGLERPKHYHKQSTEITCLLSGKALINNKEINQGDIFILEKNEIVDAFYYEDSVLVVIKFPSVIGDKHEI
jgi:dTDP-4-dehydrorhamnose 3,5-epimerase-like enzyme